MEFVTLVLKIVLISVLSFIAAMICNWIFKKKFTWLTRISSITILLSTVIGLGVSLLYIPDVVFKVPNKYLFLGLVFVIASVLTINSKLLDKKIFKTSFFVLVSVAIAILGKPVDSIYFPVIGNIYLGSFSYVLIAAWLLMITYSIDVFDNIKGLSGGVSATILAVTAIIALQTGQTLITLLNLILLSGLLGYLRFDIFNSKLNRVNKFLIGFSVGVLTLEVARIGETSTFHGIIPLAITAVPLMEGLLSLGRKLKFQRNIFIHDEHQIHNRLVALGFSHKLSNSILFAFTILFGIIGIAYKYVTDSMILTVTTISFFLIILLIFKLGYLQLNKNLVVLDEKSKDEFNRGYRITKFNVSGFIQKILFLFLDIIVVTTVLTLVRFMEIRFGLPSSEITCIREHIVWCVWGSLLWCGLLALNDLYTIAWDASRIEEVYSIFKVTVFGAVVIFLINFLISVPVLVTKGYFFIYLAVLFGGLSVGRLLFVSVLHRFNLFEFKYRRTIIVGTGNEARLIIKHIKQIPVLKFNLIGAVCEKPDDCLDEFEGLPVFGDLNQLTKILEEKNVEEVIIATENPDADELLNIIAKVDRYKIPIKLLPDYYNLLIGFRTSHLYGISLVRFVPSTMKTWEWIVKRLIDILFSLFVIVVFLPVWLIVAIIIKIDSPGPVLYSQIRSGRNKKDYKIYKFRSMVSDAESAGARWAAKNDNRITKFGNFLRKSGIDEIPQFLNVLIGDMSVVGPRPERPVFIKDLENQVEFYSRRLLVKPGITGWAQLKYKYDESLEDVKRKVKDDLFYIRNMSVLFDIKIIVQTALTVFQKYRLHH